MNSPNDTSTVIKKSFTKHTQNKKAMTQAGKLHFKNISRAIKNSLKRLLSFTHLVSLYPLTTF